MKHAKQPDRRFWLMIGIALTLVSAALFGPDITARVKYPPETDFYHRVLCLRDTPIRGVQRALADTVWVFDVVDPTSVALDVITRDRTDRVAKYAAYIKRFHSTPDTGNLEQAIPDVFSIAARQGPDRESRIGELHLRGVDAFFSIGLWTEGRDRRCIPSVGVPTTMPVEFYRNDRFVTAFRTYVSQLSAAAGTHFTHSQIDAIIKIESRLASEALTRLALRKAQQEEVHGIAPLRVQTPAMRWDELFRGAGVHAYDRVEASDPHAIQMAALYIHELSAAEFSLYLRWRILCTFAPTASKAAAKVDDAFLCALGAGGPLGLHRKINALLSSCRPDIAVRIADWTAPKKALDKVHTIETDLVAIAMQRAMAFPPAIRDRVIGKLTTLDWVNPDMVHIPDGDVSDRPVGSRAELMQQTVAELQSQRCSTFGSFLPIGSGVKLADYNASYSPSENRILVYPGLIDQENTRYLLHGPLGAVYARVGVVLGHELTHSIDGSGIQYDELGRLRPFNGASADFVRRRTEAIASQISNYPVDKNSHFEGASMDGEALADIGGMQLALAAMKLAISRMHVANEREFVREQTRIFFETFPSEETSSHTVPFRNATDPHPFWNVRTNVTLANINDYRDLYGIPVGTPMAVPPAQQVSAWPEI